MKKIITILLIQLSVLASGTFAGSNDYVACKNIHTDQGQSELQ